MTRQASQGRAASPGQNGKSLANAVILDVSPLSESVTDAEDPLQLEIFRLVEASREGRLSERGRQTDSKEKAARF